MSQIPNQTDFDANQNFGMAQSNIQSLDGLGGLAITFQNMNPSMNQAPIQGSFQENNPNMNMPLGGNLQNEVPVMLQPQMAPGQPMMSQQLLQQNVGQKKQFLQPQGKDQKIFQIRQQLKLNPQYFTQQEIDEFKKYQLFQKSAYIDLFIYSALYFIGKQPAVSAAGKRLIFPSTRQKFVTHRIFFLNCFIATYAVGGIYEYKYMQGLADKYLNEDAYTEAQHYQNEAALAAQGALPAKVNPSSAYI